MTGHHSGMRVLLFCVPLPHRGDKRVGRASSFHIPQVTHPKMAVKMVNCYRRLGGGCGYFTAIDLPCLAAKSYRNRDSVIR